ncbi:hypothetical protein HGI30_18705 [Paenibacillus albicereus]|uniref:SigmaY antisigma factor component n=1 Tax=Paenibacillus albicereus TaxID=2726185 RepID=A0A6H2H1C2_9BACL|nr:hypothetical protein [Paenibacillus albicereus]QJC53399.1 hypothetical protein HGI30_18705 [Paenibacillus albicereus]
MNRSDWEALTSLPLYVWISIFAALLAQSTWLFIDATRHGRSRWFWGLWGLIQVPTPLLVYWLWQAWERRRDRRA